MRSNNILLSIALLSFHVATPRNDPVKDSQISMITCNVNGLAGPVDNFTFDEKKTIRDIITEINLSKGTRFTDLQHGTNNLAPELTLGAIAEGRTEIALTAIAQTLASLPKLNYELRQKREALGYDESVSLEAITYDKDESSVIQIIIGKALPDGRKHRLHCTIEYEQCLEKKKDELLDALADAIEKFDSSCTYEIRTVENIDKYRYFFNLDLCGGSMNIQIRSSSGFGRPSYRIVVRSGTYQNNFFNYIATRGVEAMVL